MIKKTLILTSAALMVLSCSGKLFFDLKNWEKDRVIEQADIYLHEQPVTLTDFPAERSSGGIHDFYSEGDYWWPNPENPDGPYIRKDGMTNPDNFTAHRKAMRRMSIQVAALVAAFKITGDEKYAEHALKHIRAWFVNPQTIMNPNMLYAQAISGKLTGRGIGIIDTIHLVEVAQAILVLEKKNAVKNEDLIVIKKWFANYTEWLTTHKFGLAERDNGNNHSTCWVMQVGMYAKLTGNRIVLKQCRDLYREILLPQQMSFDGSFPQELKRTKPYGYSLFNMDAMAMVCQILSFDNVNLWEFTTEDGKNIRDAIEFLYPFIKNKSEWPYQADIMYFDDWPVRQPSLLFAGYAFRDMKYIDLWKTLVSDPVKEEVLRNFPIRQPILWI